MRLKTTLSALALAATLAAPAFAFDVTSMSDAERDAFRQEVRSYLMDNPQVLMEAISVLEQRQQETEMQADLTMLKDYHDEIVNDPASWVGGNPEGDITVVEFLDYRCGYCRKANADVEELIKSDGNIRFVIKEYPILGEQSLLSSRFAIAVRQIAGDEAYKQAHDELISLRGDATPETLGRVAKDMGLDADAILARMNAPEVTAIIDANHDLGERMQINGTPSFVIDRTIVRGYVPLDGMRQIVDGQRKG